MAMAEPVPSLPNQASRLEAELSAIDAVVHSLNGIPPEDLPRAVADLDAKMHDARELAADFARALRLWAQPETQERSARFRARVTAGEPIPTVPVDTVIEELELRRTDLGV